LAIIFFAGGFSVIAMAFWLLERSNWTEEDLVRTLPLAGLVSAFFLLALLVQVLSLLGRTQPNNETRAKVLYSMIFGGPFGMLWSVFLLTKGKDTSK